MDNKLFTDLAEVKKRDKHEYLRMLAAYKVEDPDFYYKFMQFLTKYEALNPVKIEKKFSLPGLSLIIAFFGLIIVIVIFVILLIIKK